jgi:flavin reductase (DIM6/NTAB) family NADH-FMN oxidoreductase RutF
LPRICRTHVAEQAPSSTGSPRNEPSRASALHASTVRSTRAGLLQSPSRYSFAALRATRECVIAIPDATMVSKVVKIGNTSGRGTDKLEAFDLTPLPAEHVAPPLIAECFANLECKVVDTRMVKRYNLFVLEVLEAWVDPAQKHPTTLHHRGYGTFAVDGEIIKVRSKMR